MSESTTEIEEFIQAIETITHKCGLIMKVNLGCCMTADPTVQKEIGTRISKASAAFIVLKYCIWYRKSISYEDKLRSLRACIIPILLYRCEV